MWPNPQFPADLLTFTKEILNGKLHFLCSDAAFVYLKVVGLIYFSVVLSFTIISFHCTKNKIFQ